jgi:glycosyltransferase involved in cell wall biosynthesis
MKKILLVTRPIAPPWDEASKNFAYHLAKSTENFDFSVLTPGFVNELPRNINQIPLYTQNHLDWGQRLRLLKIMPLVKQFDVLHFMLTPNKLNTFAFKFFLSNRKTKTVQTIATLREDLFSDDDFRKIIFADLVITYSDYAKNKLEQLGMYNIMRIYPGIDLEEYKPKKKHVQTLELFNIQESDFVVMYPGEYTRLGATDDIVAALPSLFERIPNAKFVFANRVKNEKDAIKKDEVIATLKAQGILDRVVFTDTFSDMPKLYNLSDVVIFPVQNMKGKFDVPLAVIEAMACAKPVIISNLPILQEFTSKNNAMIVEPANPVQLVESLVELFNDAEKRDLIGAAARLYVTMNFDINSVSKQYEQAYQRLLL